MPTHILIRNALPVDAPAIAHVLRSQGIFAFLETESPDATVARIESRIASNIPERDTVLVAEKLGVVIGYGAVRWFPGLILPGLDAYLSELFLEPQARGAGVGSKILATLRKEAEVRGATRLWCINYRERDSYKRSYYKKQGWEERDIAVFFQSL